MSLYRGQLQSDRKSIASSKHFVSSFGCHAMACWASKVEHNCYFSTSIYSISVYSPFICHWMGLALPQGLPFLKSTKKSERQPRPPSFLLTRQIQISEKSAWIPFSMVPWLNPNQSGVRLGISWAPLNGNDFVQLKLRSHYHTLDHFQVAQKPSDCFLTHQVPVPTR